MTLRTSRTRFFSRHSRIAQHLQTESPLRAALVSVLARLPAVTFRCIFRRGGSEAGDERGARVRVRGQLVRHGKPLHGSPVLLVPDSQRRLPHVPEGLLQGLRAGHDDLQDPAIQRPDCGVLPRPPVQLEQLRGAPCQRYSTMLLRMHHKYGLRTARRISRAREFHLLQGSTELRLISLEQQ